ncbi:hypothetical protein EJ110_NYTH48743 [Nymphaea thermarum]|nr:hypothetical protein EJ110_NYTH48743 [Nymphaea thermarum]
MKWMSNSLQGKFLPRFLLGWSVTTFSGVCAYPFDTVRRRMMLTSGHTIVFITRVLVLFSKVLLPICFLGLQGLEFLLCMINFVVLLTDMLS